MKSNLFFSVLLLFLLSPVLKAEYFTIQNYHVDVEVNDDGSFQVRETIDVLFETERRGIFRNIPFRYNVDGKKWKIGLSNISVQDWDYKVTRGNGQMSIRIGKPDVYVSGAQKYVITYNVENAFLWRDNRPELHWNIIGTEWEVPIEKMSYQIRFPENVNIRENEYGVVTGLVEEQNYDATITRDGNLFSGESARSFRPGEGISLAILLPEAFIEKQTFWKSLVANNKSAPVSVIIASFFFGFWRKWGANQKNMPAVEDAHYPPDHISSAESGLFIDNTVNQRDIVSLIPEWANMGYVKLEAEPATTSKRNKNIYIHRLKSLPDDFPEYQKILFHALFKTNDEVKLADLENKFFTEVAKASQELRKTLRKSGFYNPQSYRLFHTGWMIVLFGVLLVFGILTMVLFQQILSGILLILIGIFAFVVHFHKPKRTASGLELESYLHGFKRFIEDPPQETLNHLLETDPRYFEKVYPFAVAFGFDKSFTSKVEKHHTHAPYWYYFYGPHHHHRPSFQDFNKDFNVRSIQSAFVSQPTGPGSSTGGFSGSSGGGFGGGGGGSW